LSGLDVLRMAPLRLLMMIDHVGQAREQPPQKWERYGRLSTRIVVVPYTIGYGSCQRILTEQLNMHRIAAKFVPRVLTQDQKHSRVAIWQELKETVINDPTLLLNVITDDESIVYAYDPETKLQSS